jgi:hypothetical protein
MHPKGYTIIDDTVVIKALIGINKWEKDYDNIFLYSDLSDKLLQK